MKRKIKILLISAVLPLALINAQNVDDALRYSQVFYGGTARVMSMGSAFTSLGADLSAISINPAGTGMFRSSEFSFTPRLIYNNTSTVFNNNNSADFRYTFGLSQAGIVASLISNKDNTSGLINLNFAYSYNASNNFNDNTVISGISENSSMADYWAGLSQGTHYLNLTGAEGIAFDAYLIDTISGSGGSSYATIFSNYGGNANSTYGQTIKRVISNEGHLGIHEFALGGNFSDKVFFGASLSISPLRYFGHYEHLESDYDNVIPGLKYFTYTDHLEATGTGFSGKIGLIVRPISILRLGFAFHLPVWYRINEYYYDNISREFDDFDQWDATNSPMQYSYTLTTPYRVLAGASLQIGKLGIVSADYERVDYRQNRFSNADDGYNYSNENQDISDFFKSTNILRAGAEIRLRSFYLRAGTMIYGSAFKEGEDNEDLTYLSLSGGAGFRYNNFYFDLGGSNLSGSQKYYMYSDYPYLQPATIKMSRNTFAATAGFKF